MKEETVFQDMEHRRYFYATDKEDRICALVVMAELAIEHGYQMRLEAESYRSHYSTELGDSSTSSCRRHWSFQYSWQR